VNPPRSDEARRLAETIAAALDVPRWVLGLEPPPPPPPPTRRQRAAAHVGQAGWWTGHAVTRLGDRIIDAGDWLAAKVAGR